MTLRFPRKVYEREDLEAAALRLSGRAEASLKSVAGHFLVEVKPAALAGEFCNAALNHLHRRRVVAFHAPLTFAALSRLLAESFPDPRRDPLEELEPQVREDREREIASLLETARALEKKR